MSASDAAPLPRLGEVFFDVRGNARSMRLSWYSDTGVAVFSIWQAGMCTGTFRLPIGDLSRMIEILQRGPTPQRRRVVPGSAAPGRDSRSEHGSDDYGADDYGADEDYGPAAEYGPADGYGDGADYRGGEDYQGGEYARADDYRGEDYRGSDYDHAGYGAPAGYGPPGDYAPGDYSRSDDYRGGDDYGRGGYGPADDYRYPADQYAREDSYAREAGDVRDDTGGGEPGGAAYGLGADESGEFTYTTGFERPTYTTADYAAPEYPDYGQAGEPGRYAPADYDGGGSEPADWERDYRGADRRLGGPRDDYSAGDYGPQYDEYPAADYGAPPGYPPGRQAGEGGDYGARDYDYRDRPEYGTDERDDLRDPGRFVPPYVRGQDEPYRYDNLADVGRTDRYPEPGRPSADYSEGPSHPYGSPSDQADDDRYLAGRPGSHRAR